MKKLKVAPKLEDEEQSKRFVDLAKELEAKGELDAEGGDKKMEGFLHSVARKPVRP